jgi:hypothetical protein
VSKQARIKAQRINKDIIILSIFTTAEGGKKCGTPGRKTLGLKRCRNNANMSLYL